jgi:hypothetical protein
MSKSGRLWRYLGTGIARKLIATTVCAALAQLHWDAKRELVLTAGSAVGNRIYDACMLSHEASVDGKKLIA